MLKNNVLPQIYSPNYTETTDSEDTSGFSYGLYDKHADSIIPSSAAIQLESRKPSQPSTPSKSETKLKLSSFQSSISSRFNTVLASFKLSIQTLSKPVLVQSSSDESNTKLAQLRQSVKKEQEDRLAKLKKQYDEKKATLVADKRESLQKLWRIKVFPLNNKLQAAEWSRNSVQVEEEKRIKGVYEKAFQEALKIETQELEKQIEEHFYGQFQEKINEMTPSSCYKDANELRAAVEDELSVRKIQERIKWDAEGKSIREKVEKKFRHESEIAEENIENEVRGKWTQQTRDKIELEKTKIQDRLQKTEKNLVKDFQVTEFTELWTEECKSEVFEESLLQFKQEASPGILKELKKTVNHLVENKLMKSDQVKIFHEVGEELNLNFELFKREAELFLKKQISMYEETVKGSLGERIEEKSKEKIEAMEKEVLIKYLQKLEKQKQKIRKEFEEKDLSEVKKVRECLMKEKQLVAQYRAKNNIDISRLDEEIRQNFLKLEEETNKLDLKVREIQVKNKIHSRAARTEKITSKTPSRPAISCMSALSPDIHKQTPTDLVPTCSSAKGVHLNYEFSTKMNSPYRGSPRNLHAQFLEKVPMRDPSTTKSMTFDNFKFQSREVLNTTQLKQNMYHELLKEKFGFIQPRLK